VLPVKLWTCWIALCAVALLSFGTWIAVRPLLAKGFGMQSESAEPWDRDNPVVPLPVPPIGVVHRFDELPDPPTPQRVRLGRWLFYDRRLSADGSLSCASCHRPEHAFSELTPHSTGIHGQQGVRKAPSFVNAAWQIYPNFFWDGRASSLEAQALGPITNPIEMGNTHAAMVRTLVGVQSYAKYFEECFGDRAVTADRVSKAIADYERTRLSGNSPFDRWQLGHDASALSAKAKKGYELFTFGKAACNQCHLGPNFTDSAFHNLGVGYDAASGKFADDGRYAVTKNEADRGSFKTPTLRDVAKHPPYLHDGSAKTLRDVIDLYNHAGNRNPHLDPKMKPLNLTPDESDALVAFLESLNGEGYQDSPPTAFPR
jgi:cytochrome c peroxidase